MSENLPLFENAAGATNGQEPAGRSVSPDSAAQNETSSPLASVTQGPQRCARPNCQGLARTGRWGKRPGKYCSDKCGAEVWAYKHRRRSIACGPRRRRSLEQRFKAWLDSNDGQTVYVEALRRALQLRAAGWKHYSVDAIVQSIRFDHSVKVGPDGDGFKINDCHRSRLARLLMEKEAQLADFFETRRLHGGA